MNKIIYILSGAFLLIQKQSLSVSFDNINA